MGQPVHKKENIESLELMHFDNMKLNGAEAIVNAFRSYFSSAYEFKNGLATYNGIQVE